MSHKGKKILIIEDDLPLLRALVDKFVREDMVVLDAVDGEAGLELALQERPDIILLDILMPKVDGITMLKRLRQDDWGKNVPVIVLTNLTDAEKIGEAIKGGAYEFLIKSDWSLDDIVKKIGSMLDRA